MPKLLTLEEADGLLTVEKRMSVATILARAKKDADRTALPRDAGRNMVLAKCLCTTVFGQSGVSCIMETGIWPNNEDVLAFHALRYFQHGEQMTLEQFPAELLDFKTDYAVSIIHVMLNNFWDFVIVDLGTRDWVFCSHDEWLASQINDRVNGKLLRQMLKSWL